MDLKKDIVLGNLVISIFVFILAASALYIQTQISSGNACGCIIPLPLFIPFLGSLGLFIGVVFYSILFPNEQNQTISEELFLKMFDGDQRKFMKNLLKSQGEQLQVNVVKETDLSKVKVHRIIKKLDSKGIIDKESYGRTNRIKLKEEFSEHLPLGS